MFLGVTKEEVDRIQEDVNKCIVREVIGMSIQDDLKSRHPDKIRMVGLPGSNIPEVGLYNDMVRYGIPGAKLWYTGIEADPEIASIIDKNKEKLHPEDRNRFKIVTGDISDLNTIKALGVATKWRKQDVVWLDLYRMPKSGSCNVVKEMHKMGLLSDKAMVIMTASARKRPLDAYYSMRNDMERLCTIPGCRAHRFLDICYGVMMVVVGVTHSGNNLPIFRGRLHFGANSKVLIEKPDYRLV